MTPPLTLAITGASGAAYGLRLLEILLQQHYPVYLMISRPALVVINTETALRLPARPKEIQTVLTEHYHAAAGQLQVFGRDAWMAPVASGSGGGRAMVVCPCSSATLSAIACGASRTLIERAADVTLKERRKLILVHRETPLSTIHLENMLRLTRLGAVILPASPGFYHQPVTVEDLVDFIVARVLDHLEVAHDLMTPWGNGVETMGKSTV